VRLRRSTVQHERAPIADYPHSDGRSGGPGGIQ
jgi:hypothetical protein